MSETLKGAYFVALRRLTTADGTVIAEVGQTCERVPAPTDGRTVSDALRMLMASGKIAPKRAADKDVS